MDPIVVKYAQRSVPCYTSYPTAPHFHAGVDGETYGGWLGALDPAEPVSLYLHVPFCRQVCWYCGCNMKLASRYEPVADYVGTLLREIALVAAALPGQIRVSHLHWGGGTPTSLEPDDLVRVMGAIAGSFAFTPDAELAIEADPRTLTLVMIRRIGELGFTRASFGVQEFDARVQAAINRRQSPEMVRDVVDALRAEGVNGVNFDLIYGLPHQTVETLTRTIDLSMAMRPDRIALFGYAHVPWMAKKQRMISEDALPGARERMDQATAAADRLVEHGYVAVGLDHFARPEDPLAVAHADGGLRRNFQGYNTDRATTMLGLGATSIGRTPSGYVQAERETGAWARAVEAGRLPVAKGLAFSADDRLRGAVIERLMCTDAVDTDAVGRDFGAPAGWAAGEIDALGGMAAEGLLEIDGQAIRLTERGRPLVRTVAATFDAYLEGSGVRHSVAV